MQAVDRHEEVLEETPRDLESYWPGLKYVKCTGIENVGAPKNIYTEDYPESDGPRVFHPSDKDGGRVAHKETNIALTIAFVNDKNFRETYNSFCRYISSGRLYFWDTFRNKKMLLLLNKEIAPETDVVKGVKHIISTFNFTNLWGIARHCNESGEIITEE